MDNGWNYSCHTFFWGLGLIQMEASNSSVKSINSFMELTLYVDLDQASVYPSNFPAIFLFAKSAP